MDRPKQFKQVEAISNADAIVQRSLFDVLHSRERPVSLFTPALLVTHGGFDRDPVLEFDARFPEPSRDLRPFCTELQRDHEMFFSGLGVSSVPGMVRPVAWDKRLYCIDQSRAEECFAFIGGIAFSDPRNGFFANVFSYDLQIPDPTSLRAQYLSVTVFGVIANTFVAMLEGRLNKPPKARRIAMPSAQAAAQFVNSCGIQTIFTGEDPLDMRE
jgi:hypothetical protein